MSTFYLLPPRDELGQRLADHLQSWFPGATFEPRQLAELVVATAEESPGVVALFGDELPDYLGTQLDELLEDAFGAESEDQVVDLRNGPAEPQGISPTWFVRGSECSTPLRKVC